MPERPPISELTAAFSRDQIFSALDLGPTAYLPPGICEAILRCTLWPATEHRWVCPEVVTILWLQDAHVCKNTPTFTDFDWLFLKEHFKTRQSRDIKEGTYFSRFLVQKTFKPSKIVWADQPTAKRVILKNTYFLAQQLKNWNILFEI